MESELATTLSARRSAPGRRASPFRRHVNLTVELALTQFKLKYTGSVLGYAWSLLKPFFLFGITYAVFIYILKVSGTEFGVQLLISIVLWTFFAEATSAATSSIAGNGHLLRKAAFPRIVLVIASTLTPLISFIINITLIVAVTWLIGHLHPGVRSLVVPLLLFEFYLLIIGVGLILASLFVFYRDIGHLWEIFSQLLFYGSAIVFPFKLLISHGHLARLVSVNPLAQIVEDMRRALVIADPDVPWTLWVDGMPLFVVPLMLVAVLLAIGILTFRRLSPRFAESL